MTEQPNRGQPYQQPYPYQQQPYPPQQYRAPQQYPQGPPQQYAGPGQQYPGGPPNPGQQQPYGQQPLGQQPYGQPPYGQPPQGPYQPPGPDQAQAGPKPKKKRGPWATFFIVLFSPFIALAFVAYGIYWVLCWLLTPVALVVHFVLCGLGLIWFSLVKVLASGGSKYRLFQPMYPKFPPFWTGGYWVRLNRRVRSTFEGLAAIAELLNW
jgi:hypothetical protein